MNLFLVVVVLGGWMVAHADAGRNPPNVVLIFADDLGFGDLGCYGAKGYRTPHLDRLARGGVILKRHVVPQAVCSASRAALLTGCYPNRVGILGALGPGSKTGIHEEEITMAEILKQRGYATAVLGKWHLGDHPRFSPLRHGFDEYYGLPYSNDMWPRHPTGTYPDLPLMEGEKVVALNPDQSRLTGEYTDRAIRFMETHRARPFFIYLAHSMPHVPLFAGEGFRGRTKRGLFGDVLEEVDHSVGRMVEALERLGLRKHTLVIFTSDNGPWLSYGDHAGWAPGLREGKGTTFEGGVRVPCIVSCPGVLPKGKKIWHWVSSMDWFPTVAARAGAVLSPGRILDGRDLWPILTGKAGGDPGREAFAYYWGKELQAIRVGDWKLHFPHAYLKPMPPGRGGKPGTLRTQRQERALYHLKEDPAERKNLIDQRPDMANRLEEAAVRVRRDLGDSLTGEVGRGVRPAGRLD
ncbi:MAG: sulfatase [Verrucomicrobia bacterium]|nr:sulfatase [Verrucomicrobiota bacterium]